MTFDDYRFVIRDVYLLSDDEASTAFWSMFFERRSSRITVTNDVVGIGPGSALVSYFESVGFVNAFDTEGSRSAFLELNSTYTNFTENYCVPGTAFNVSVNLREDVAVSYFGGLDDRTSDRIAFTRSPRMLDGRSLSTLAVTPEYRMQLEEIIIRNGGRIDYGDNLVFTSCASIRPHLPPIILNFAESDGTVKGRFRFEPAHYTKIVDGDRCELHLGLVPVGRGPLNREEPRIIHSPAVQVDFLRFETVNVRFTDQQISFCKSSL